MQGEAVVGGEEVHRRQRAAAARGEDVRGAGQPVGEVADTATVAPGAAVAAEPGLAHGVAVAVVPLRPRWREAAELVAAGAHVPRLRDQLHRREHRVLRQHVEEGAVRLERVVAAGQRWCQVEPEAVDVHLLDPVAQRVGHHRQGAPVPEVEGVPAAGHVGVAAAAEEPVVGHVVQAAPGQHRAVGAALGRVVVDDVEEHLDAGGVQRPHQVAELTDLLTARAPGRVVGVRREEAHRVVAPVVRGPAPQQRRLAAEVLHRQQLHGRDTEPEEVLDRRRVRQTGVRPAELLGDARVRRGEALDVQLVDHRVGPRDVGRPVALPVVRRVDDHRVRHERGRVVRVRLGVVLAEGRAEHGGVGPQRTEQCAGVGVGEQLGGVEAVAVPGVPRPVHPVAVALPGPDALDPPVPDVVGPVEPHPALGAVVVEQAQVDRLAAAEDRERRAAVVEVRAEPGRTRSLAHGRRSAIAPGRYGVAHD